MCSEVFYRPQGGADLGLAGERKSLVVQLKEITMLTWALIFFVIAMVAALLGFAAIAGAAAGIAKLIFFVFIVLCVVALVGQIARGRRHT